MLVFNTREKNRQELLFDLNYKISLARNTIYGIAVFGILRIPYIFSHYRYAAAKGFLTVLLGVIYAILGIWSKNRPLTAILTGLFITITFVAINTGIQIKNGQLYPLAVFQLVVQIGLIYILAQGAKAAFKADLFEDEFKM